MNIRWIVRVKDLSDNTIAQLLDYGTVEILSDISKLIILTMNSGMKEKIKKCESVLAIERYSTELVNELNSMDDNLISIKRFNLTR
jgi:hypothetical protein